MSRSRSPAAGHGGRQNLGDVHSILKGLKDDVAALEEEMESKSSQYFNQFAQDLAEVNDGVKVLSDTLSEATSGIEQRNIDAIPGVVPDYRSATLEFNEIVKMTREISAAMGETKMSYHAFALASKDIVNDADKMDIVVKACQTEFIKLKLMTNNTKARLNAHRLGWARLGFAFRMWAEMVHFATIECIKNEMEEVEAEAGKWRAEFGDSLDHARAELDKLLGGQRRTKMELMLRKMKNSRQASAFVTWYDALMARKYAEMDAERQKLLADYEKRFGHLSKDEIERKLRQFMLRWINRKMLAPWKCWKDIWKAKKLADMKAGLDADLAAMRNKLAAMGDNAALQKLKIYFATKLGQTKSMCFKALCVDANQKKAMKLLESEAGQRLKAFLAGKLQGLGRKCWSAWLRHHDNIATENMKNNDRAKKVALLLEKLARGLVHRQFAGFVRYHHLMVEEREAEAAILARLAMLDECNKAKLRIFLDGKRLGKMSSFFKWWADVWRNSALYQLQDLTEAEDAAIAELEARVAEAEAALGGEGAKLQGKQGQMQSLNKAIEQLESRIRDLSTQLATAKRNIAECEDMIADEQAGRKAAVAQIRALEAELDAVYQERDGLAAELAGIAGEIGYVHKDSQF